MRRRGACSRPGLLCVLVLCATSYATACARRSADPSAGDARVTAADSLRGVVRVSGPAPGQLMLALASGAAVEIVATETDVMRAADGLEVAVFGARAGVGGTTPATTAFIVARFEVRAVDGISAVDGTLLLRDGRYVLRLADGALAPLAAPPAALRAAVGARVYVAGPLTAAPLAYGILALAH
jgi:hypothetical protein